MCGEVLDCVMFFNFVDELCVVGIKVFFKEYLVLFEVFDCDVIE